jgi:hypothetical protein
MARQSNATAKRRELLVHQLDTTDSCGGAKLHHTPVYRAGLFCL